MSFAFETQALSKDYGHARGVQDVTLAVRSGQIFGFLGPNGAGKSTFVKLLVGLIRPTAGTATVLGEPLGSVTARRSIGYLPELFRYQDWLTAEEVLRLHAQLCGLRDGAVHARIPLLLQEVGLARSAQERVRRFSKGMQQRLGIACALLGNPKLLFLDEPSSALDPLGRHDILLLLQRLAAEGKTIFLNTHLLEDVESVCDEVALLWSGRVRWQGSVQEILSTRLHWQIQVAGLTAQAVQNLALLGCQVQVTAESPDGSAVLQVELTDREMLGYVHAQLQSDGVTIYETERIRTRVTDWFLAHARESAEQREDAP